MLNRGLNSFRIYAQVGDFSVIVKSSRTFVASSTDNPCNIRSGVCACYWQNTQNHKWYVFHICRTNFVNS